LPASSASQFTCTTSTDLNFSALRLGTVLGLRMQKVPISAPVRTSVHFTVEIMKRYGSLIRLLPEKYEEYKKLHSALWPGVLAMIHQ